MSATSRHSVAAAVCMHAPVVLLTIVASSQLLIATTSELTPWKGGGFGMFATMDSPQNRTVHGYVLTETGDKPVQFATATDRETLFAMVSYPSRDRLRALEETIVRLRWTQDPPLPSGVEGTLRPAGDPSSVATAPPMLTRLHRSGPFDSRREVSFESAKVQVWGLRYDRAFRRMSRWLIASYEGGQAQ